MHLKMRLVELVWAPKQLNTQGQMKQEQEQVQKVQFQRKSDLWGNTGHRDSWSAYPQSN